MAPSKVFFLSTIVAAFFTLHPALAVNFPFEEIQLNETDIGNFTAIRFANVSNWEAPPFGNRSHGNQQQDCRAFPGSPDWPTEDEWTRLNTTLGGALLKPVPAAIACYPGPEYNRQRCQYLTRIASFTHFFLDDPQMVLTQWPQGNTCLQPSSAFSLGGFGFGFPPQAPTAAPIQGNCTLGGFPVYVVHATTVKHIQAAVNFARNKNLRLVIKNTGHDFGGRSVGAGALSVWVHSLKSFEFLPTYEIGEYKGMAVRYGAGLESWELFNYMDEHNISVAAPGGSTVGALGGWLGFGGHGSLTSYIGLGSDQVLSLEVVTADGRLVTADPFQNSDLFWALRGAGGSTYGIMTSVVMKAFPPMNMTSSSVNLEFNPNGASPLGFPGGLLNATNSTGYPPPFFFPNISSSDNPFNLTNPFNFSNPMPFNFSAPFNGSGPFPFAFPPNSTFNGTFNGTGIFDFPRPGLVNSSEAFWKGIEIYYRYGKEVLDAGGMCYGYIYPLGNGSFSFTSSQTLVNMAPERAQALMQPLYDELESAIGVRLANPLPRFSLMYGSGHRQGGGDGPVQTRYRSRLFPRETWQDEKAFSATMMAIRRSIEAGYTFHGIMHAPSLQVAGWPGRDSAVNPAYRRALLHASLMETQPVGLNASEARRWDASARAQLDAWRAVSPGSGAYINEGDPAEPDWQQSFYGNGTDHYARLLTIKHQRDPWGLFWAPTTVGSEAWEVRSVDGYPGSQNGKLCRVRHLDVE